MKHLQILTLKNPMRCIAFLAFCLPYYSAMAQHTFSIVAVDSLTGEIGSAGATCGDSIIWPGTPGAKLISDIIPGVGAIHTQSYYLAANQINAHNRLLAGDNPQKIINWLIANDIENDESIRQYGIVDYNGGHPRSAAFTGTGCMDYKNHLTGKNYSIQGNILIGRKVLDSMEARFNKTKGPLCDKLMAAMQGANIVGADSRCSSNGTSSLSAFIRVAKPSDNPSALYLDINVAGTSPRTEPIDILQNKFTSWKSTLDLRSSICKKNPKFTPFPNPCHTTLFIDIDPGFADQIILSDPLGRILVSQPIGASHLKIDMHSWSNGLYFITVYKSGIILHTSQVFKN